MARERLWKSGDTCKYQDCTKTLRTYSDPKDLGSHIGEGLIGMCSIHHRKYKVAEGLPPGKIQIDWSKTHNCVTCGIELRKRGTKKDDLDGGMVIGQATDSGYECRSCQDLVLRRAKGMKPMNRPLVSEDGLSQRCNVCKEWFEYSSGNFRKSNSKWGYGYRVYCNECDNDYRRAARLADPDKFMQNIKRTRYNINYNEILLEQDGKCAICKTDDPQGWKGRTTFDVDHDHNCCSGHRSCGECVRGLLCGICNVAIGLYKDDAGKIKELHGGSIWGNAAVSYLSKFVQ